MADIGLTHVALESTDIDRSIDFYARYAAMQVVHRRQDGKGGDVAWISDRTRPFVIVLVKVANITASLAPWAHLGVGFASHRPRTDPSLDTMAAPIRTGS